MHDRTEYGGLALILAIMALLLVPGVYVFAHPHPMGLHAWAATLAGAAGQVEQASNQPSKVIRTKSTV